MPITEYLIRNAFLHGNEVALTEINPAIRENHGVTWHEFDLVEPNPAKRYRREMTWREFNELSNRFAHMMLERGIGRGNKIALLLMNFSRNDRSVSESRAWLKRIIITWAILNSLGFIMAYVTPFFSGGQFTA